MTRASLTLLLALASGCFTGRVKDESPWDLALADSLEVGKSTRADVLRILGAPTEIVRLRPGEAYIYEHKVSKRSAFFAVILATHRDDTQRDAVVVVTDEKGVVSAVGRRANAEKASFGTPWGD